jgi:uncharacterized membrane protein
VDSLTPQGAALPDLRASGIARKECGDMETRGETGMVVRRSITVNRPLEDVYGFWRNLDNLARHSQHLQSVTVDGKRSHWIAHAPAGKTVEWDSELIEDVPNERLAWRSLPGSEIRNEGFITFSSASGDRGTEVRVQMRYDPPAGRPGATIAKLFGEEPEQQLRDDLRRYKQVLETGEVVLSDGSLEGAGQGPGKQRPARPVREAHEAREARS